MDKYEYKVCLEEIDTLISEGDFGRAVEIADTIDWKRVKSVNTLCQISDLYKVNHRFEESRDILLLAYDRYPTGRQIVSSLCDLELRLGEYVQALQYYNEFVQIAPRDPGRYILQYKIYKAQSVSLPEQIAVLQKLKAADYRDRWAYELALLYYRNGDKTLCVSECDELIAFFGDGRFVENAKALKAEALGVEQPAPAPQAPAQPEPAAEGAQDAAYADQNYDPNAGYADQNYDPNAGYADQNYDPNAGYADQNYDPNAGYADQNYNPNAGYADRMRLMPARVMTRTLVMRTRITTRMRLMPARVMTRTLVMRTRTSTRMRLMPARVTTRIRVMRIRTTIPTQATRTRAMHRTLTPPLHTLHSRRTTSRRCRTRASTRRNCATW